MTTKKAVDQLPSGEDIEQGGKGLLYSALALTIGMGLVFVGKKYFGSLIEERQFENASQQALQIGTPENFASRLYDAIDGIGTDEDEIFAVFSEMPTKSFYQRVYRAYRVITGGNDLNADLRGDLDEDDLRKTQQLLHSKPN